MENWLDSYSEVLRAKLYEIKKNKGILIGFNVNIDKIIKINPDVISRILTSEIVDALELSEKSPPTIIDNRIDLFSCLLHSVKYERAEEMLTDSQELCTWIENTFRIEESRIGGQAGIIANLYTKLGMQKVLLSLPEYNRELYHLLNPDVLTIIEHGTDYAINPIPSPKSNIKLPIDHYVFEFSPGTYMMGDVKIESRRANRFILSHDMINTKLKFSKGLLDYCDKFIGEYSLAIISGFHLINEEMNSSMSFSEIIHPVESMLIKWKENSPNLCIHLEIASTRDIELRKTIIKMLFPIVDSIGLNEQELMSFMEVINPELADNLMRSLNPISVFNALKQILDKYPNLRIHFHYLGYFMILSKPITSENAVKRRRGLIIASLLAAIKAKGKEIVSLEEIEEVSLDISMRGFEEITQLYKHLEANYSKEQYQNENGIFHSALFSFVGVPSVVVSKPKKTVGLGDLISSISILYESQ